MQRDFLEPGGFGETLGDDVSQLASAVKLCADVLAAFCEAGLLVVHMREGPQPDLSDGAHPHSRRSRLRHIVRALYPIKGEMLRAG